MPRMSDGELDGIREYLLGHAKRAEARAARTRYKSWHERARDATREEGARQAFR